MRTSLRILAVIMLAGLLGVAVHAEARGNGSKPGAGKATEAGTVAPAAGQAAPAPAASTPPARTTVASAQTSAPAADSGATRSGDLTASVTFLKGMARLQRKGAADFAVLTLGAVMREGDTVVTLDSTRLEIKLDTGQIIRLGASTKFTLASMKRSALGGVRGVFKVMAGRLWFTLGKLTGDSDIRTETPTVVAAVKGTVYRADVAGDGTTDLAVYDGVVAAGRPGEPTVDVAANEKLAALPNAALEKGMIDEGTDEKDDWVRWNKTRDKLRIMIIIPEIRGEEKALASVSENTAMKRFMSNYLFKVIEKEQVDRLREGEKMKAALKGDNAAAAAAGLEIAADIIIVGQASAKYFKNPALGGLISATANMTLRAVRADTAEVLAASSDIVARAVDITDEAAAYKALQAAGEKAASQFVDSIVTRWRRELRRGAALDVIVDGVNFRSLKTVVNTLSTLEGVSDVQSLYLVGRRSLLNVTSKGDTAALAEAIETASFGALQVRVVGLSAYRLELEVTGGTRAAAPAKTEAAPAEAAPAPAEAPKAEAPSGTATPAGAGGGNK